MDNELADQCAQRRFEEVSQGVRSDEAGNGRGQRRKRPATLHLRVNGGSIRITGGSTEGRRCRENGPPALASISQEFSEGREIYNAR